jgi:hypothetical protein
MSVKDGVTLIWIAIAALYFVPTFVSFYRNDPTWWFVFLVNLFFSWTGLGWIWTLFWAITRDVENQGY